MKSLFVGFIIGAIAACAVFFVVYRQGPTIEDIEGARKESRVWQNRYTDVKEKLGGEISARAEDGKKIEKLESDLKTTREDLRTANAHLIDYEEALSGKKPGPGPIKE